MKNLFYIIIVVFSINIKAQTIVPVEQLINYTNNVQSVEKGKYFKDVNGVLNKFLGTWKYQDLPMNPTKVLEVTFYKSENNSAGGYYEDIIYAKYKYSENNIIIFDTYPRSSNLYIIGSRFSDPLNTNIYLLMYGEPTLGSKSLKYNFAIEYLPVVNGIETLKWDVDILFEIAEGATLPKIPQHIVLTKQ